MNNFFENRGSVKELVEATSLPSSWGERQLQTICFLDWIAIWIIFVKAAFC